MKKLVVFGDSFVEGYTKAGKIENNFVKLLGDYLEVETINIGFRGHGNIAISYDVLNYVRNFDTSDTVFLVVWSEWDRQYLINDSIAGQYDRFTYLAGIQAGNLNFSTELRDDGVKRWQSEMAYYGVCNVLREADIPFLMISSQCNQMLFDFRMVPKPSEDGKGGILVPDSRPFKFIRSEKSLQEHWIEYPSTNNTLFDIIIDNWLNEKPRYYVLKISHVRSKQNRLNYDKMTIDLHPNEEGHKLIAKTLEPYIRRIL